jgi:hypothetical protein
MMPSLGPITARWNWSSGKSAPIFGIQVFNPLIAGNGCFQGRARAFNRNCSIIREIYKKLPQAIPDMSLLV